MSVEKSGRKGKTVKRGVGDSGTNGEKDRGSGSLTGGGMGEVIVWEARLAEGRAGRHAGRPPTHRPSSATIGQLLLFRFVPAFNIESVLFPCSCWDSSVEHGFLCVYFFYSFIVRARARVCVI